MTAPLYHGTRAGFRHRGGLVLPRASHGGVATTAPVNPGQTVPDDAAEYVYVTTSPLIAWVYAWHAPGRGRPRVLTVTPLGEVTPDPEHHPAMEAYRCQAAAVQAVSFAPIITEAEARDGWAVSA